MRPAAPKTSHAGEIAALLLLTFAAISAARSAEPVEHEVRSGAIMIMKDDPVEPVHVGSRAQSSLRAAAVSGNQPR